MQQPIKDQDDGEPVSARENHLNVGFPEVISFGMLIGNNVKLIKESPLNAKNCGDNVLYEYYIMP